MTTTYRPTPGEPIEGLDTPVLLLDLDALEHNIGVIATHYRGTEVRLRPHVKNHKSPQIAWMQISAGGTVGGVCAAKVSEAEVFVEAGVPNVLVANQVVAPQKVRRLASLARRADVTVAVDDAEQVRRLSEGAVALDATLGVVVEVDTMMRRGGIRAVEQGVALAKLIAGTPGLRFRGVMSHQVPQTARPTREERFAQGARFMGVVLEVTRAIEAAGIPIDIVSTGESWTYDVAATLPGVTEIEGGTYIVMEEPYTYMDEFRYAARIMGTVISRPDQHTAIGDIGVDAIGAPNGPPTVEGLEGVRAELTADATVLTSEGPMPLRVGERYFLITHQQDVTMNRWEHYVGVRNGVVEAVIDAPARGCTT